MKYTKAQLRDALKWAESESVFPCPKLNARLVEAGHFSAGDNAAEILAAAYRDQSAMVGQLKAALDKALEENLAMRGKL